MSKKTMIGLDVNQSKNLAKDLNALLSEFQIFYINTRGFHWNIKGDKFFELHLKFEELYTNAQLKIDEIAERILTLGHIPLHSFTDFLKHASIKESSNVSDRKKAIAIILKSYQQIIKIERALLELSAKANDEGTNALMSDYIREQEKEVWMYNAYLN